MVIWQKDGGCLYYSPTAVENGRTVHPGMSLQLVRFAVFFVFVLKDYFLTILPEILFKKSFKKFNQENKLPNWQKNEKCPSFINCINSKLCPISASIFREHFVSVTRCHRAPANTVGTTGALVAVWLAASLQPITNR